MSTPDTNRPPPELATAPGEAAIRDEARRIRTRGLWRVEIACTAFIVIWLAAQYLLEPAIGLTIVGIAAFAILFLLTRKKG